MKSLKAFFLFYLFVIFFSCKKDASDFASDPNLFKDYIVSYSGGLISTNAEIRTILAFENLDWQPNQELDSDLYSISPNVKGKVIAINTNTVAFIPSEKLKQDTEYFVSFNLKELKNDLPKDLHSFKFVAKTLKQNFAVTFSDLQSYSKNYQYLNMFFQSSDNLTLEEAKKLVTAKQQGKDLKVKFKPNKTLQNNFEFYIDSIQRPNEDSEIEIFWDGSPLDIDQKGNLKFPISGKNNFKIVNVDLSDDEEAITINFSDPVKGSQNFAGLVQLISESKGESLYDDPTYLDTSNNFTSHKLKFATAGNVLKVYYPNNITGDQKLEVLAGILSEDNHRLKETHTSNLNIGSNKPEVAFIKSGSILPSSNGLKINFKSINLNAVDVKVYKVYKNNILQYFQDYNYNSTYFDLKHVGGPIAKQTVYLNPNKLQKMNRWNVYALDLSKLITPDPGTVYSVEISFKKSHTILACNAADEIEEEALDTDEGQVKSTTNYDYDYGYDYNWQERNDPCTKSYYYNRSIKTTILATDLGVIAKRGENGNYHFAVTNIVTSMPESGAEIKLYTYQQQLLSTIKTDSDGFANVKLDKYAYFAVVTKDNNTTYIKLDDGTPLSLSNFNVDGVQLQKGLKGFIYGERGVWRPGDTLYLGFILNDLDSKLDASHPITLRVNDIQGKTKYKGVKPYQKGHHYLFKVPTHPNDATGNWEARISVGGANFYKKIKVETIKPNRLKIKNSLGDREISTSGTNNAQISVNWLHGAIARNLKTEVQAKITRGITEFKGFESFDFDDEVRSFYTEEVNVFSGRLDDNGKSSFNFLPNAITTAPGKLKAIIQTRVYENGGDFSTDVVTTTISPYQTYIGIKAPKSNQFGMLETDKSNVFEIKTVSANGSPKAVSKLNVEIYKIHWRWWWNSFEGELSQYNYSDSKVAYKTLQLNTNSSGSASFSLNIPEQDWGRYLIRVIDEQGGHATSLTSLIDWPIWSGKSKNNGSDTANMLLFSSDKESYKVNETAKISIPSSVGGRALISIESGSQVLSTKWIETKAGETVVEVPITDKMAPNAYVHVSLLKPHAQTISDTPIRMYGIINLEVTNEETKLYPQINMPKVLRPEEKAVVKVSEKNGKAMSYTIAIVDEGLLDLTRFKTPDAWKQFNSRLALGVKTWDIFNDVIGAYGGRLNQVFSIGGDEDLGGSEAKKANRFEPVVRVLGPFSIDKNKTATHEIKLPNYIGSVRTMVIASNLEDNSYGSTEVTTPVRKPLMVLASLPRKISPNEKVTLPVTVFAMENHIKNVSLQIKTSGKTKVVGAASQNIYFENPEEKMAYFDLEVNDIEGIETIEVIAKSGKETASYKIEIDVTNPNPAITRYTDVVLEPNSAKTLQFETFGITGSNKANLEVSSFPTINFNGRLNYLIQYPHGCAEQITSIAFPQLYYADLADVDASRKANMQRNVNATLNLLNSYQTANGGFSYWPGNYVVDDWTTSYIGHFIIEAEAKGYILPEGMKSKWITYQQKTAKQWRTDAGSNSDFAQSYRLYTLAIAGSPDLASMNRLRETSNLSTEGRLRLAATYALVKQTKVAKDLLAKSDTNDLSRYSYNYYGSFDRNRAMLLETYLTLDEKTKAFELAKTLATSLSSEEYMSTQTIAYSLYAMSKFAKKMGAEGLTVNYNFANKTESIKTDKSIADKKLKVTKGLHSVKLENKGKNTIYARVAVSGVLPIGEEISIAQNLRTNVRFKTRSGNDVSLQNIEQGTEIIATVTIENTSDSKIDNVALQQIVPSGFEIINLRYTDFGASFENKADYIDIRDDRAQYYFGLGARETRTFTTVVNASYLGKYYLPGVYAEAMYNNNYSARTQGQWINIVASN